MSLNISKFFGGMDKQGASVDKIDTYLEYIELGNYLNGNFFNEKVDVAYQDLSEQDKGMLQKLYQEAQKLFSKIIKGESLPIITDDNAKEYSRVYSWYQNDDNEQEIPMWKNIQIALNKYLAQNGQKSIDVEATKRKNVGIGLSSKDFEFVMCDIDVENDTFNYPNAVGGILNAKKQSQINQAKAEKCLQSLINPYDNSKLQSYLDEFIEQNNIKELKLKNGDVDLGNGMFDKVSTQQTNVCWGLSDINALLTTEEGKLLLDSNKYYDEKTGLFAIHLQEAEDKGFHDGIYIITPEEILAEAPNYATGEGDATAYLLAVKHYFEEVNSNLELIEKMKNEAHSTRDLEEGNFGFRLFELLTGGEHIEYKSCEDLKKCDGIGVGAPDAIGFDFVKDIVENKKGAVTIALGGHSISVVGVKDDMLIVQEPNNDRSFEAEFVDFQNGHKVFEQTDDINDAPAYTISQYDYEGYIKSVSYLKWSELK